MKKAKNISICILAVLCAGLAVVCVFMTFSKDKTPPEINFADIIISYTEGDDTSVLFTGVSASDLVDGDVTDRMIIKSITTERDGFATVTYAVTDKSHNVAERSKRIIYKTKPTAATTQSGTDTATTASTKKKK